MSIPLACLCLVLVQAKDVHAPRRQKVLPDLQKIRLQYFGNVPWHFLGLTDRFSTRNIGVAFLR